MRGSFGAVWAIHARNHARVTGKLLYFGGGGKTKTVNFRKNFEYHNLLAHRSQGSESRYRGFHSEGKTKRRPRTSAAPDSSPKEDVHEEHFDSFAASRSTKKQGNQEQERTEKTEKAARNRALSVLRFLCCLLLV